MPIDPSVRARVLSDRLVRQALPHPSAVPPDADILLTEVDRLELCLGIATAALQEIADGCAPEVEDHYSLQTQKHLRAIGAAREALTALGRDPIGSNPETGKGG